MIEWMEDKDGLFLYEEGKPFVRVYEMLESKDVWCVSIADAGFVDEKRYLDKETAKHLGVYYFNHGEWP